METPHGEQRQVVQRSAIAIDGAPISYIITLAAVVGALAFIPLSMILGLGKSFPLSQAIYPLIGILLGPVAGALADGIGSLVGVLLFPHTSFLPIATIIGAAFGGFAAGGVNEHTQRRWLAWSVAVFAWLAYIGYVAFAVTQNGVSLPVILLATLINSSALLLYTLPTRRLAAQWLKHPDLKRVAAGLFLATWMCAGMTHLVTGGIIYFRQAWPSEIFVGMTIPAPIENAIRASVGSAIGTGVIAGLRSIGLTKPDHAAY